MRSRDLARLELAAQLVAEAGEPALAPTRCSRVARSSALQLLGHLVRALRDVSELVAAGGDDRRREVVAAEPLEARDQRAEAREHRACRSRSRSRARRRGTARRRRFARSSPSAARPSPRRTPSASACSSNAVVCSICAATRARLACIVLHLAAAVASPPSPAISRRDVAIADVEVVLDREPQRGGLPHRQRVVRVARRA